MDETSQLVLNEVKLEHGLFGHESGRVKTG